MQEFLDKAEKWILHNTMRELLLDSESTEEVGEFVDDNNYRTCWCDNCQKITRWEDVLTVTPLEAKEIILEDDDTDIGGISRFGETLEEFMESAQIPYTASIEDIDGALIECGIKPVFEQCS